MGIVLQTAPATEPLTTAEAKLHLRVDHSTDDDLIDGLIQAAREWCENYTRRGFITQTYDWTLPKFPSIELELPRAPASSITHIKYYDTAGDQQTYASASYESDFTGIRAKVRAVTSWPATQADDYDAVEIRFVCGYGAAADVPQPIKQAMYLLIGHWYENRELSVVGTIVAEIPMAAKALLAPYVITEAH